MPRAICEDCGALVEAELTHNGVCLVGHYVHCGWGHVLHPDDLIPDDAAEAEIERLRAALLRSAAALAASISLLERGGEDAAPSRTMFAQMLEDYKSALKSARAALIDKEAGDDEASQP